MDLIKCEGQQPSTHQIKYSWKQVIFSPLPSSPLLFFTKYTLEDTALVRKPKHQYAHKHINKQVLHPTQTQRALGKGVRGLSFKLRNLFMLVRSVFYSKLHMTLLLDLLIIGIFKGSFILSQFSNYIVL